MAESSQTTPRDSKLLNVLMSAVLLTALVAVTAGWTLFLGSSLLKVLGL